MDAFLAELGVSRVDVLKVDAQGAEMLVLVGAMRTLQESRPYVLLRCHEAKCLRHGVGTLSVQRLLLSCDYALYRLTPSGRRRIKRPEPEEDATFLAVPSFFGGCP